MDSATQSLESATPSRTSSAPNFKRLIIAGWVLLSAAMSVYYLRWVVHGFELFKQDDSGFYLYIGQQVAQGARLYRDVWDQKPPLLYYFNAVGVWLTPGSAAGVFLLCVLVSVVFWCFLLRAYWRIAPSVWTLLAGLLAFRAFWDIVATPNFSEVLALPLQAIFLWLFISDLQGRAPKYTAFLQGACVVLLFHTRPNHIGIAIVWMLYALIEAWRLKQVRWMRLAQTAAGGLAALLCVYIPLVRSGVLPDALNAFVLGGARYVSKNANRLQSLIAGLRLMGQSPLGWLAAASVCYLAALGYRRKLRHPALALFAVGWLIVELPLACISGYLWTHYYIPWLAPLALLIVVAGAEFDLQMEPWLARIRDPRFFHRLATGATLAGCVMLLGFYSYEFALALSIPADTDEVLLLAQRLSVPGERIATWGDMPPGFWFDFGHPSTPMFCTCLVLNPDLYLWSSNRMLDQITELQPSIIIEKASVLPLFAPDPQGTMGIFPLAKYIGWENQQLTDRKQALKLRYEEAGRDGRFIVWRLKM